MRRNIFFIFGISAALFFCGCTKTTSDEDSTTEEEAQVIISETKTEDTEVSDATDAETTQDETSDTDDEADETSDDTSSTSSRMEETTNTYTINNITINYPVLIGMSDTEAQEWANEQLYEDAMSIIDLYDVDVEADTLTVDYEVSLIYRSEFSLVYSGTLVQGSSTINIRISDDLDLSQMEHVRLSDRLSSSKLISCIESGDYTVLSTNFDEETLREYLSTLSDDFYEALISSADFGGTDTPEGFSYNYLGNVAVIIPVPHMFGDYAEISIVQQTK